MLKNASNLEVTDGPPKGKMWAIFIRNNIVMKMKNLDTGVLLFYSAYY